MQIKYLGPSGEVIVAPYGPHRKGDVKEYPDDFARELLATSIKQQFEAVGDWEEEAPEPEVETEGGPNEEAIIEAETRVEAIEETKEEIEAETEKNIGIDAMTVAQIKAELDTLGIEYSDKARKAELFELLAHSNIAHSS